MCFKRTLKKYTSRFFGLMVLAGILFSCGLESAVEINPPTALPSIDADNKFQLKLTSANDDDALKGLEFYYKFYDDKDSITTKDRGISTIDELTYSGNHFYRLHAATDKTGELVYPFVFIPTSARGKEAALTIDFSDMANAFIEASPIDTGALEFNPTEIRRGVYYSAGVQKDEAKEFDQMDKTTDQDFTSIGLTPANNGDQIVIIMYALCYGKKSLSESVYSKAVYLGYITFPYTE